jgi:hypothetical protein
VTPVSGFFSVVFVREFILTICVVQYIYTSSSKTRSNSAKTGFLMYDIGLESNEERKKAVNITRVFLSRIIVM